MEKFKEFLRALNTKFHDIGVSDKGNAAPGILFTINLDMVETKYFGYGHRFKLFNENVASFIFRYRSKF